MSKSEYRGGAGAAAVGFSVRSRSAEAVQQCPCKILAKMHALLASRATVSLQGCVLSLVCSVGRMAAAEPCKILARANDRGIACRSDCATAQDIGVRGDEQSIFPNSCLGTAPVSRLTVILFLS